MQIEKIPVVAKGYGLQKDKQKEHRGFLGQ